MKSEYMLEAETRGNEAISEGDKTKWERAVIDALIEFCDCPNGDAQGIFEAQQDAMDRAWQKKASVEETLAVFAL